MCIFVVCLSLQLRGVDSAVVLQLSGDEGSVSNLSWSGKLRLQTTQNVCISPISPQFIRDFAMLAGSLVTPQFVASL